MPSLFKTSSATQRLSAAHWECLHRPKWPVQRTLLMTQSETTVKMPEPQLKRTVLCMMKWHWDNLRNKIFTRISGSVCTWIANFHINLICALEFSLTILTKYYSESLVDAPTGLYFVDIWYCKNKSHSWCPSGCTIVGLWCYIAFWSSHHCQHWLQICLHGRLSNIGSIHG